MNVKKIFGNRAALETSWMHYGPKWYENDAFISKTSLFLMSSGVSERASDWAQWSARAKWAVRSKQLSEQCERTSEQRSEWPSTIRVDFISFQPTVECDVDQILHIWKVIFRISKGTRPILAIRCTSLACERRLSGQTYGRMDTPSCRDAWRI